MSSAMFSEEQFVTDAKGKRVAVMLDLKSYERLREAAEELEDIRAFDAAWPKAEADWKAGKLITLDEFEVRRAAKRK